jgi:hypothetical protein
MEDERRIAEARLDLQAYIHLPERKHEGRSSTRCKQSVCIRKRYSPAKVLIDVSIVLWKMHFVDTRRVQAQVQARARGAFRGKDRHWVVVQLLQHQLPQGEVEATSRRSSIIWTLKSVYLCGYTHILAFVSLD